jgi:pyruvate dehydrogenase E2 component (dihydrolipoamide acetyltransferase)
METEVIVPPLGQTVDVMTLVAWYKNEGEMVTQGEILFALETDKSTLDVEAPASGILHQLRAKPGDEVTALSVIALIGETVSPGQAVTSKVVEPILSKGLDQAAIPIGSSSQPLAPPHARLFISPRARQLAEAHNVPLTALAATGPEGAIIERDVHGYLAQQQAASTEELFELIPLSRARATIARRMLESTATTAQVTLTTEADATRLVELRQQWRQGGTAVSYNDLFIFILALALRDYSQLNASLDEAQQSIKVWRPVHMGLAVDTEVGLLVPVVRDVGGKSLPQLAAETKALIERAQAGQCTPDELRGSTFTLTNLGMFGIDAFTPLLNLPECALLGVGRIKTQPVIYGDAVVGRQMVWLSLTFDHRLIDGGPAARFLQRVAQLVEHPP